MKQIKLNIEDDHYHTLNPIYRLAMLESVHGKGVQIGDRWTGDRNGEGGVLLDSFTSIADREGIYEFNKHRRLSGEENGSYK